MVTVLRSSDDDCPLNDDGPWRLEPILRATLLHSKQRHCSSTYVLCTIPHLVLPLLPAISSYRESLATPRHATLHYATSDPFL